MPRFRLTRIASPGLLKTISPDRLLRFLDPMRGHLQERGFGWPCSENDRTDYEKLGRLLHFPNEGLPNEMVVPLVLVDEMSTDEQMDRLIATAVRRQIELGLTDNNNSPADVAVQCWLEAPGLLEELHAENHRIRQRNFCYFAGINAEPRAFPKVSDGTLRALERDLDDCFEQYQRGRGSRVFVFDHGRKVWVLVRRGATFKREESMKDGGQPSIQFYRPLMYDVLVYDTQADDLGLHVETKWQERMYLRCIGQHIFGNKKYFPSARILSFDPLIKHGAAALRCDDVPGMRDVKLAEAHKRWDNDQNEIDIKKADDIFALGERGHAFLRSATLTKLVFSVSFDDAEKARSVTARWPNVTKYERDSDSERIERWLRRREFMPRDERARDAAARRLWRTLRSIPGAATSRYAWQELLADEWPLVAPLLRPTGSVVARVSCPSAGGDGCPRRVVRHADGRIVAVCGDHEGRCDPVELTLDDIVVHELDLEKLADALCQLLGLKSEMRSLSFAGPVWQVGWYKPVAGERFAVVLSLPVGSDQVHDAAVRLRGHYDRPFLLLTPTHASIEPTTVEYLRAGRSRALCLEEVLGVGPDGDWQPLRPAEELLREFRRDVVGEVRFGRPEHRFPTPPGTGWEHVAMRFINGHEVAIRVQGREGGVCHYAHMGMTKTNKDEPTVQWDLLHDLAEGRGELLWPKTVGRGAVLKRRERLADHLQGFFGIDGDPFEDLPGGCGFKARFTVVPEL